MKNCEGELALLKSTLLTGARSQWALNKEKTNPLCEFDLSWKRGYSFLLLKNICYCF